MASISIRHPHHLDPTQARARVNTIADALAGKYGVRCHWQDNCLHFERSGIAGQIRVDDNRVDVSAELGLALRPLRGKLQTEVTRMLMEKFP